MSPAAYMTGMHARPFWNTKPCWSHVCYRGHVAYGSNIGAKAVIILLVAVYAPCFSQLTATVSPTACYIVASQRFVLRAYSWITALQIHNFKQLGSTRTAMHTY